MGEKNFPCIHFLMIKKFSDYLQIFSHENFKRKFMEGNFANIVVF